MLCNMSKQRRPTRLWNKSRKKKKSLLCSRISSCCGKNCLSWSIFCLSWTPWCFEEETWSWRLFRSARFVIFMAPSTNEVPRIPLTLFLDLVNCLSDLIHWTWMDQLMRSNMMRANISRGPLNRFWSLKNKTSSGQGPNNSPWLTITWANYHTKSLLISVHSSAYPTCSLTL